MTVQEVAEAIRKEASKVIVGQDEPFTLLLVALLSGGHVLLEGVPGTAKTLMAKTLAQIIQADFKRVQFTPDLMPSDVVGTQVFEVNTGQFRLHKGPIFTQILLGDEINRAPAKTQAALLEAMEERQVTIEGQRLSLAEPFFVVATQNPIEYEGTYPLPEAQLDRFLFKIQVPYAPQEVEMEVLRRYDAGFDARRLESAAVRAIISPETHARMSRRDQQDPRGAGHHQIYHRHRPREPQEPRSALGCFVARQHRALTHLQNLRRYAGPQLYHARRCEVLGTARLSPPHYSQARGRDRRTQPRYGDRSPLGAGRSSALSAPQKVFRVSLLCACPLLHKSEHSQTIFQSAFSTHLLHHCRALAARSQPQRRLLARPPTAIRVLAATWGLSVCAERPPQNLRLPVRHIAQAKLYPAKE